VKELLKRFVPARIRFVIQHFMGKPMDWLDILLKRRDPLMPPRSLIFVGGNSRNFRQLGERWLQTFIRLGELKPHERVLDLGCGIGRMSVPLTGYLDDKGSYEGLDIVYEGIRWCQKEITPRFPHFRFQQADVFSSYYNPNGKFKASEYRLPYSDNNFDFVFLTSVFTHMLLPDVTNYLGEVHRVMRPGGRCLITFFLLNEESLAHIKTKETQPGREFRDEIGGGCRSTDAKTAESAIAYPEEVVRAMFDKCGLRISDLHYGGWSGRQESHHGQDIFVAHKVR